MSDGEWLYGYLNEALSPIKVNNDVSNLRIGRSFVRTSTIGQFTGLHDKNGKEIYEGDLVRYGERNYVVSYEDSHKGAFSLIRNNTFVGCFGTPYPFEPFYVEVVGNIHDYRKYPKGGEK